MGASSSVIRGAVESNPQSYFGSKEYKEGKQLIHSEYHYLLDCNIFHRKTGIRMWSLAFDVREDCQPGQDLRDGDFVLFHYTDRESFEKITAFSSTELRASFRVGDNKDSYFGHGIYATQKAPHEWRSKDHLLVNNYWPAKKVFEAEYPGQTFPDDGDLESLVKNKESPAFQRLQRLFGQQWEYCIPLIVDQHVAKNVMTEPTDAPLMPKDDHGKRKKRLAGYNRFGEKQPAWRNVWVISVYDAEELVAYEPKPKNATQSIEAIAEILYQRLAQRDTAHWLEFFYHDARKFKDVFINMLEKLTPEEEQTYGWLYLRLAEIMEEPFVRIKGERWDAKRLWEKAVQVDGGSAYDSLARRMKSDRTMGRYKRTIGPCIGQETLDETQLWIRAIEAKPHNLDAYVELAELLYPLDSTDPQEVVELFGEDWDWKRLLVRSLELGDRPYKINLSYRYRALADRLQAGNTVTVNGESIDRETARRRAATQ